MQQNQSFLKSKFGKSTQRVVPNSKTWNNWQHWRNQTFLSDSPYKNSYDFFLNRIGSSLLSVLELGCSTGNVAEYMLACNNELKWTGIDYAQAMVEKAKKNCPTAEFISLDARDLKAWRQKFDAIMLHFFIHYFSPAELCDYLPAWMHRVKKNGLVYISFIQGNPSNSRTQINSKGKSIDFYYYSLVSMKQALKDCGIHIVYEEQLPNQSFENKIEYHCILIGIKGNPK